MKRKIIIVDDSAINLQIGLNVLKNDYDVRTVPSGEKLFQLLERITPDIILLDIQMPEMDGFEVIQRLKSNPQTSLIPVIFMTSSNSIKFEEQCFTMGAADFMHKPYYGPFLIKRIETHLQTGFSEKKIQEYEEKLLKSQKAL